MSLDLASLRKEYTKASLDLDSVADSPIEQFQKWFTEAQKSELTEPNAMIVGTSDGAGQITQRTVLLKAFDTKGFVFYTNYKSRKASHLEKNPNACIHFPWFALQRQVVVTGLVSKLGEQVAEDYFRSRPTLSKLGAWASQQSEEVDSRESLEKAFLEAKEKWGEDPPKPPHWGGFSLFPHSIEFWQGGPNRLHDRFIYSRRKDGENWEIKRLNP